MEVAALTFYLLLCLIVAVAAGYERTLGFFPSLLLCIAFTPLLGGLATMLFKRLPKACCMMDYQDFSTGDTYYFRRVKRNGTTYYKVLHAASHRMNEDEFNRYFSIILNSSDTEDKKALGSKMNYN